MNSSPDMYDVMGFEVAAVTENELVELLLAGPPSQPSIIAHLNLHGLYVARRDPGMRELLRKAALIHVDGMPIVWLGRLMGHPLRRIHRVTFADLLPTLLGPRSGATPRVFVVGGEPELETRVRSRIAKSCPDVRFGHHHGFFDVASDGPENQAVLTAVRDFAPTLLFVGMGMPRQERWILDNLGSFPPCYVMPCGAGFHYYSGLMTAPPRWSGRIGMEWIFRLVAEPRRLMARYLLEPLVLGPWVIRELINRAFTRR